MNATSKGSIFLNIFNSLAYHDGNLLKKTHCVLPSQLKVNCEGKTHFQHRLILQGLLQESLRGNGRPSL